MKNNSNLYDYFVPIHISHINLRKSSEIDKDTSNFKNILRSASLISDE